MAPVTHLGDRRWWPMAQQDWTDGLAALAPRELADELADEWRASMRRLAKHLGTRVRTRVANNGRLLAEANEGFPLGLDTTEDRVAWVEAQGP